MTHAKETDLALFASGDASLWQRLRLRMHLGRCAQCREVAAAYQADREGLKQEASRMPPGVDWEHLAAEMTANIRVGLEAGECAQLAVEGRQLDIEVVEHAQPQRDELPSCRGKLGSSQRLAAGLRA